MSTASGYVPSMTALPGTLLTCTNTNCGCELEVRRPCPHGDDYTCACGHPLTSGAHSAGIGDRAEEAGIVDQQAMASERLEGSGPI